MSVIIVLAPVMMVSGGWPIFCAAAVTAAAGLGYRKISACAALASEEGFEEIEMSMEQSRIVAENLAEDQKITLDRGDVQVEFYKDPRGRFSVHVRGKGLKKHELEEAGKELIGRVRQQYAYQRLVSELEERGYQVDTEQATEDRSIRLRLQRTV